MRARGAAAFLGAGAGLFLHSAGRILRVLFWPRVGSGVLALALPAAGAVLLAAAFLAARERKGQTRPGVWGHLVWGAAGCVWLLAGSVIEIDPSSGPTAGTLLFAALLTGLPVAATAGVLFRREMDQGAFAIFGVTLGGGMLAAAGLGRIDAAAVAAAGVAFAALPGVFTKSAKGAARAAAAFLTVTAAAVALAGRPDIPAAPLSPLPGEGWQRGQTLWINDSLGESYFHEDGRQRIAVNGGLREWRLHERGRGGMAFLPDPGEDGTLDVLAVGLPDPRLLAPLMEERSLALTIVEPDRALVLSAVELWPDLAAARAGGKAEIHVGNPRWYLRRDRSRYDIILLAAGLSPAAHVAGALSYEERYLYTKEAFRSYAAHLSPGGLLFVRRPGNGRVASTLREAMEGEAGPSFHRRVVVTGLRKHLVSDLYYRPGGFGGRELFRLTRKARRAGTKTLYSPRTRERKNRYYSLIRGEHRRASYFVSPQDLSPVRDERPFMEHLDRVMMSPTGPPFPEELGRLSWDWRLVLLPRADRIFLAALLASLVLGAGTLVLPFTARREKTEPRRSPSVPGALFLVAFAGALAFRGLLAFAGWHDPLPDYPGWTAGLFFIGAGMAWRCGASGERRRAPLRLAALGVVMGVAGYPLGEVLLEVGQGWWMIILSALALAAGVLSGASAGGLFRRAAAVLPEGEVFLSSALLAGAAAGWAAAMVVAVTFGVPLLWLAAALFALWAMGAAREF